MSRLFSLVVLGAAVCLLASSAVLAQEVPRERKPQPPAAKTVKPKPQPPAAQRDAASEPVDREAAIERALASPTQIDFVETPLQDVVDYLKDLHRIEIQIDIKVFKDTGMDPSTPISRNLKGISLRSALKLMLRDLDLAYVIQDEVLLITTPENAGTHLATKVYPVADLVVCRNGKGQLWDDYDTLSDAIRGTIQPTTWDENGGPGSIAGASLGTAKVLIVSQTQDVHQQITDVLVQIRAAAVKTLGAGPPQRDKKEPAPGGCCLPAH